MDWIRGGSPPLFHEDHSEYAGIGLAIVWVSWLEKSIQDFLFSCLRFDRTRTLLAVKRALEVRENKILKKDPKLPSPKYYPDVVVQILLFFPKLRKEPFWDDGTLNLNAIALMIEQAFDMRNHLAHGAVEVTEKDGNTTRYTATKLQLKVGTKRTYGSERYRFSDVVLSRLCDDARVLTRYLNRLEEVLEEKRAWEQVYTMEKQIIENRKFMAELIRSGKIQPSPELKALYPHVQNPLEFTEK